MPKRFACWIAPGVRGDLLSAQQQHDEAMREYRIVIDLLPAHEPAYRRLGHVLLRIGKLQAAADTFLTPSG